MANPIIEGLQRALDEWLDVESNSFGAGKRLEDMWVEEKGVATPYQPDGVLRLIDKVQAQPVFKNSARAQQLGSGQFGPNRLDTFGDLVDHLS